MTDEELVKAAREAREEARLASSCATWVVASRRLFDLVQEAARREINMCRIFDKG